MLRLRPYKNCDAESIIRWIRDEKTFRQWSAGRLGEYPLTAERLQQHYDSFKDADNFYEMTAFDEEGIAGHMIMRFLDEEKTILRFGFIILDDSRRGKGYGKEMLRLALRYAFAILKVRKVTLVVMEDNAAAHHCYLASGFRGTGNEEYYSIHGEEWKGLELEFTDEADLK